MGHYELLLGFVYADCWPEMTIARSGMLHTSSILTVNLPLTYASSPAPAGGAHQGRRCHRAVPG